MSQSRLQNDTLVRTFGQRIITQDLRPILLLTLEAGRPLAFLAAQLIWLAQPALSLGFEPRLMKWLAQLLEEPGSIDELIDNLDAEK